MNSEKVTLKIVVEKIKNKISKLEERVKLTNFDLLEICQKPKIGIAGYDKSFHLPHELLEVAVNLYVTGKYCCETAPNIFENSKILEDLEKLENQIPVKSWRSSEQQLLQQLSTPPAIAFLMAKILNPSPEDLILEPSAGTGSLIVWLKATGCKLHLNELSNKRRNLLEMQGFMPTDYNAEFIDDLLPKEIAPDGVLMNPPFSSSAGRVKSNNSSFGFRHLRSAIERLKTGGKFVALFGTQALTKSAKGKMFLREISDEFDLKGILNLPQNSYFKYGTNIGVTILCLRKAKSPKVGKQPVNINCSTLKEVLNFINLFDEQS